MAWCEDRAIWGGKSRRRQLGLEEKAVDGALVLKWGRGKDLGLAQPGASLADAAADWMRGPPLTDCWRVELCVPGRPKPPLCLAFSPCLSLPESTPPSLYLSLSPVLPLSPFHCSLQLHTNPHTHTQCKNMLAADTHKKLCTKIISFKCSKANG